MFFLSSGMYSQQPEELEKVLSHSPNAALLGTYGEVNMINGIPDIQIPLYAVKTNKLEVPLSLSYNAGGIRVDEEASAIGLGWILKAGGAIIRVIRDKDDFGGTGFKSRFNKISDVNDIGGDQVKLQAEYQYDNEPDLFILHTFKHNDKFCLDNSGNFTSLNLEPFIFEVNYTNNLIIVTDNDGVVFRFGKGLDGTEAFETTYENYGYTGLGPSVTAWYLTEIISADKTDTIEFKYQTYPYSNHTVPFVDRFEIIKDIYTSGLDGNGTLHSGITYGSKSTSIPNARIIDKIIFANGIVKFSLVNDRQDVRSNNMPNDHARISGFSVLGDNNSIITKVVFKNDDYFYRTGGGTQIAHWTQPSPHQGKSLKINGIEFLNNKDIVSKAFQFKYDPTSLPPRNTTCQDLWGYYNGKISSDFIPSNFYIDNTPGLNSPNFIGTNRDPDFNYAKAAVLNKITYPTGGYTQYEYEPNYYLNPQQKENKIERSKTVRAYAMTRSSACDPEQWPLNPSSTISFTIDEDLGSSTVLGRFYFYFSDYLNHSGQPMTIKLYRGSSSTPERTYMHMPWESKNRKIINETFQLNKNDTYRVELSTGNVTGSVLGPCNSPFIEFGVSYDYWETASESMVAPMQAGGLRIKRISNHGVNGELMNSKIYQYGENLYGPLSIGVGDLISNPNNNFYYKPTLYRLLNSCNADLKDVIHFTSSSQVLLGFNNGSPVEYSKITEKIIGTDGSTNGKTEFFYSRTGQVHELKDSRYYPYPFFSYPEWQKSNLIKTVYSRFDNVINDYLPIRMVEKEYTSAFEKEIKTLKIFEVEPDVWTWNYCDQYGYDNNPNRFYYYNSKMSAGRNRLVKEVTTDFVSGGTTISNVVRFSYNKQHQIRTKEIIDSKGQKFAITNFYAPDYLISNPQYDGAKAIKKLQQINRTSSLVESYTQVTGINGSSSTLSAVFYEYSPDVPFIKKIWELPKHSISLMPAKSVGNDIIKDSRYYPSVHFDLYDKKGNLLQQRKNNDRYLVYLWDYKDGYLTAEVENSSIHNIAFTSFEAEGTGNWSGITPVDIENVGGLTGTKFYKKDNFIISKSSLSDISYVVTYWSKNGSYSINGTNAGYPKVVNSINRGGSVWQLYEHLVTGQSLITIKGSGGIDELRLYPSDAQMTTYTYEPLIGMTSRTDANNRITYYEYDGLGRLGLIRDQNNNIIKKICYNYAGQPEECNCTDLSPIWQDTSTPLRCKISNNKNTGEQEQEQKDQNPCSPSYNQTRWVVIGTNLTACPLPAGCDYSNCFGEDKKCVNNICETGIKVFTASYNEGNRSYCVYHYEWSNGSWSPNITVEVPFGLRCRVSVIE